MNEGLTREELVLALQDSTALERLVSAKKYQQEGEDSFDDVIERVTLFYEEHSKDSLLSDQYKVTDMLRGKRFLPAGSILSGLGNTTNKCSLSNCYLTKIDNDSIESIFEAQKKLARTYSYRGGSGIDITVLRPDGHPVSNAALTSSGAVSFMPIFSELTNTIGQHGRRGALMISLDIRHPDTMRFIWSKSKPEEVYGKDPLTGKVPDVYGANISLKITDAFMQAVEEDADWTFVFPDREASPQLYEEKWDGDYEKWAANGGTLKEYDSIPAREILKQIAGAAWTSGDPGVIFIDTAQQMTPGTYIDSERLKPVSTNPCGEQFLSYWSNCLLGALVLSEYVRDPWSAAPMFDWTLFKDDVYSAVCFMDTMSDINIYLHPLQEQREADAYGKRLGIEFTGLGDTLAMLGLRYGSDESFEFVEKLMKLKRDTELFASAQLAKEFGPCEALESQEARESLVNCPYMDDVPQNIKRQILEHGMRNTALNTVGPTGSLSIVAGNLTSGIEPVFAFSYTRVTRISDTNKKYNVVHPPVIKHMLMMSEEELQKYSIDELKEGFNYVEAGELSYMDRLKMQAVVQKYTDSSISSTVNLPNDATTETIQDIYTKAWVLGLKGVTVFRDGCKDGVLSTTPEKTEPKEDEVRVAPGVFVKELQDCEIAERHRINWKGAKMYIIVSLDEDDHPVEVFVKLPREAGINGDGKTYREDIYQEKFSLWETVTRLTSMLLRMGLPLNQVIKQLDKSSYSLVDASAVLARVLRKYLDKSFEDFEDEEIVENGLGELCGECGAKAYIYEGGCGVCKNCGYTTCG